MKQHDVQTFYRSGKLLAPCHLSKHLIMHKCIGYRVYLLFICQWIVHCHVARVIHIYCQCQYVNVSTEEYYAHTFIPSILSLSVKPVTQFLEDNRILGTFKWAKMISTVMLQMWATKKSRCSLFFHWEDVKIDHFKPCQAMMLPRSKIHSILNDKVSLVH